MANLTVSPTYTICCIDMHFCCNPIIQRLINRYGITNILTTLLSEKRFNKNKKIKGGGNFSLNSKVIYQTKRKPGLNYCMESQTDNRVFRLQSIDQKKPQRQLALSSRRNPLHILTLTQGILQIHYQHFCTKDLRGDVQQEVRSRQIRVCFPFKQE